MKQHAGTFTPKLYDDLCRKTHRRLVSVSICSICLKHQVASQMSHLPCVVVHVHSSQIIMCSQERSSSVTEGLSWDFPVVSCGPRAKRYSETWCVLPVMETVGLLHPCSGQPLVLSCGRTWRSQGLWNKHYCVGFCCPPECHVRCN